MRRVPRRWRGVALFVAGLAVSIAGLHYGAPQAAWGGLVAALLGSRMISDYAYGRTSE